jgi:AcrR family transcriptional regulator
MREAEEKKPARQRILDTAAEMFYRDGIRAVGIDAIIAGSGVAKMSLYRNFPSKDASSALGWMSATGFSGGAGTRRRPPAPATPEANSKRSSI